jgi:hypothetical protein
MLTTPEVLRRTGGKPVKSIIYDESTIAARVSELGADITEAYPDGELLILGLLKGSFIFLSDLVRTIERPIQVDFLVASSYGDGKVSSGAVRLLYDPETRLEGKHILLVEDIIDTGASRSARSSTSSSPSRFVRSSASSDSGRHRLSWSGTASTTLRTIVISRSSRTWNKWQTDFRPGPLAPTGGI